jgi:hypothetical protein
MIDIRMPKAFHLPQAHPGSIHNTGMVIFVNNDKIFRANQGRNNPQINLHPGAENQGGLFANKSGQSLFQFQMQAKCPI